MRVPKPVYFSLAFIGYMSVGVMNAQDAIRYTEKVLRINIINPAIEQEYPVSPRSTIAANLGVGAEGAYRRLAEDLSRPYYDYYMLTPYAKATYRVYHNLEKRIIRGKNAGYNSGDYFGVRFLIRGPELYSRYPRSGNLDFSYGPIWGIQRALGKLHFHLALGPMYYFDTYGNSGFSPLYLDINLGINLN